MCILNEKKPTPAIKKKGPLHWDAKTETEGIFEKLRYHFLKDNRNGKIPGVILLTFFNMGPLI